MANLDRSSALSELRIGPVGAGAGIPCLRRKNFSSQNRPLAARACKLSRNGVFVAACQLLFPCERVRDNRIEILKSRTPRQRCMDTLDVCDKRRRIARTTARNRNGEIASAGAPYGVDDLENRRAATIAAVERCTGPAVSQIGKRRRMRVDQIAHVNVVANAGAIRRGIVRAENFHFWTLADGRFAGDLDEVSCSQRCLAGAHFWIGACDVEVAQGYETQAVGPGRVV